MKLYQQPTFMMPVLISPIQTSDLQKQSVLPSIELCSNSGYREEQSFRCSLPYGQCQCSYRNKCKPCCSYCHPCFVQDSFNIGSIGIYIPRLIFLDGPNQFIETMRLVRQGSIRLPTDTDTAIDTLINFAGSVRDSNIPNNLTVPLVSFFPNIFRGAETLVGQIYSIRLPSSPPWGLETSTLEA
ncbi:hypothetical protein Ocin01_08308 [Orchesella cincta]|uniref:Uncharacterized protein n=1 Tax=Orchesella cincta TaxID=48709 RepID=A0A1D2MZC5_ORCCI|nr:hypothetical protein Ocin01_08308 [Orchesella cincta]